MVRTRMMGVGMRRMVRELVLLNLRLLSREWRECFGEEGMVTAGSGRDVEDGVVI